MEINVNGRPRRLDGVVTVGTLVDDEAPDRRGVAVALDGQVLPRGRWDETVLGDGASVEILGAVQGG